MKANLRVIKHPATALVTLQGFRNHKNFTTLKVLVLRDYRKEDKKKVFAEPFKLLKMTLEK